MPQQAKVSAVDAIEAFRASLLVYVNQARPALEEISADALRTRLWLEDEQRVHWQNQLRRRTKALEEAQQALFSARLGTLRHESAADQMAVHRAKDAVEEAEIKLRILKKWRREFDGRVQPLVKQMERLHTLLSHDMVKAAAYLAQTVSTLADYAQIRSPAAGSVTAPAAEPFGAPPAGQNETASPEEGTP